MGEECGKCCLTRLFIDPEKSRIWVRLCKGFVTTGHVWLTTKVNNCPRSPQPVNPSARQPFDPSTLRNRQTTKMTGDHHYLKTDPAIERWSEMRQNQHKYFAWNARNARLTIVWGLLVPIGLTWLAFRTDVSNQSINCLLSLSSHESFFFF